MIYCKLAHPPNPFKPLRRLDSMEMAAIHLVKAVGIQGEAHDLLNEPFSVLCGEMFTQLRLELRDKLSVDLAYNRLDVGHLPNLLVSRCLKRP